MQGLEKYVLVFTDSPPSKEDFSNLDMANKFSYDFTSCVIYLVDKCLETLKLPASLRSSYNKVNKPRYAILNT